jgi:two-component system sensor histidine kinase/response regulator
MNSSKNLYALLENLLTWARAQSGKMIFSPKPISISGLINNNIYLLKTSAKKKGINLIYNENSKSKVYADEDMLNTLVRNLISNSIKFTPKNGEIKLQVNDNSKESLIIIFSDTGIGMTKEQLDALFILDKTNSTKGTDEERGTGLGLILCKEFVEKHHGKIWAESTLGAGSTFYIELPK